MSFELFRNPFAKSKDSSVKFESLQDQLNAKANKKGLQYPIDLGTKDNQDFLLFTIYDNSPTSFHSTDTPNARMLNATFDGEAMKKSQNQFENAQQSISAGLQGTDPLAALNASLMSEGEKITNFYNNQLDDPLQQARLKSDTLKVQSQMSKTRFAGNNPQSPAGGAKRTMYSIAMYMPATGIVSSLSTSYKGENFGMMKVGQAAVGAAGVAAKQFFGGADADGNKTDTGPRDALIETLKQVGTSVIAESGDSVAGMMGMNLNSAAAIGAGRRKVLNPHMEFMFESVGQRSYNYTFSFTPRNIEESKMVHDIIRIFRIAALPRDDHGIALDYPAEFGIQYFRGGVENTWLPRIARCALSGVELDFTPNSQVQQHAPIEFDDITGFHVSGSPPASINLKLTFQEMNTLVRKDVQDGGF